MLFINRFCNLRKRSLIRQGKIVFSHPEGTLDDFLEATFRYLNLTYPKFYKMDRMSKAGILAVEILAPDKCLAKEYSSESVALVFSNKHASLDTDLRYVESTKTISSPALFVYTLPNIVMGEICIRQGIRGENAFFVLPEFDGDHLADYVGLVMKNEKTQACLAGWVDVLGEQHDVFLYLVEKRKDPDGMEHTADQLRKLYHS